MSDHVPDCSPYPPICISFHPIEFEPRWRSEVVVALARGIDADAAFDRLPVLADALEEAGCDRPEVLRHCRECPRHHPRCWVINLVLDRPAEPHLPLLSPELLALLEQARQVPSVRPQPRASSGGRGGAFPLLFVVWVLFSGASGFLRLMSNNPQPTPSPPPVKFYPPSTRPLFDPATLTTNPATAERHRKLTELLQKLKAADGPSMPTETKETPTPPTK